MHAADGAKVEVTLGPPWGDLQLPLEQGTIKRITPRLLVVDVTRSADPKAQAAAWCAAIASHGGTCDGSPEDLPEDQFDAPVTVDGAEYRLRLVSVMGAPTLMIAPPPPDGASRRNPRAPAP